MAVIFKFSDEKARVLEVNLGQEGINFWIGEEFDEQSWTTVTLTKEDTIELVEILQKLIEGLK